MKNIITGLFLIFTISTFAQTGIGTTTPNTNAQLEVASTTKGFLPPRVALTGTTSASPLAAHVAGMVVYNTATVSDVTPGLYVNNGTVWEKQIGVTNINDLSDGKIEWGTSVYLGSVNGTGSRNVAVGVQTLYHTNSYDNTALGYSALLNNSSGRENIAVGSEALSLNTTGVGNVALGFRAGQRTITSASNLTSSNSIYIGWDARASADGVSDETVIGNQASGNGSNTVTIGNASVTGAYTKVAWTITSDMRDKNNFAPLDRGLAFINKLKPISFEFRKSRNTEETDGIKRFGFKAQDIEAIENGDFVIVDNKDAAHLKIKETYIIPILVKGMQEQQKEIDAVKKELSDLKALLKAKGLLD
ncbi:tail fiber domain-containing protein [Lutibacter sp.]|uniref:tail fiber domain-containing protein n=1 Tax=Lutibacter sp. TaxID=1925666 RepID=UPI0025C59A4E|nr:tail fiber domain-containing protein [Lutibacter sp.]MCF6182033.1 tail fiber domain-containing protein [Lutibacter sp.]